MARLLPGLFAPCGGRARRSRRAFAAGKIVLKRQFLRSCDGIAYGGGSKMETRVALIGIIVENPDSVERLNSLLHDYSQYIIGRMGVPYRERGVSIISVVMDAPADAISAMSGRLGMLPGISTKTIYSKVGMARK